MIMSYAHLVAKCLIVYNKKGGKVMKLLMSGFTLLFCAKFRKYEGENIFSDFPTWQIEILRDSKKSQIEMYL